MSENYIKEEIRRKSLEATNQKYFVSRLRIGVLKIQTTDIHEEPILYPFPEQRYMTYLLRTAIRTLVDSLCRRHYPFKIPINIAVL